MWSLLSRAAEAIAPAVVTPLDELKASWSAIREFYAEGEEDLEAAEIPRHLNDMVQVVLDEEEEDLAASESDDDGSRGRPCLHFLLKQNIIETLCLIAARNHPQGVRKIVLATLSTLLRCMRHPLLSYVNVHKPVQQLVEQCLDSLRQVALSKDTPASPKPPSQCTSDNGDERPGVSLASVMDDEFVELLVTIVHCLENDKRLIALFCKPAPSGTSFPLFDALVTVMPYSNRARKGIQEACELTPSVRAFVAAKKGFLSDVVRLVADEYRARISGARPSCLGSAVEFCDALLVYPPHDLLSVNILEAISQELCNQILLPDLLSMREEAAISATRFMADMLPKCSARRTQDCMLAFLLGGSVGRCSAAGEDEARGLTFIRMTLLMRILDHKHEQLQVASAELIGGILRLNHRRAFESLLAQELPSEPRQLPLELCKEFGKRYAAVAGLSVADVEGSASANTASMMVADRRVAFSLWSSPHFSSYPVQEAAGDGEPLVPAPAEVDEGVVAAAAEAGAKLSLVVVLERLLADISALTSTMKRVLASLLLSVCAFPHAPLLHRLFLADGDASCLRWLSSAVADAKARLQKDGKWAPLLSATAGNATTEEVEIIVNGCRGSLEELADAWTYFCFARAARGISAILLTHANETIAAKVATRVFCADAATS